MTVAPLVTSVVIYWGFRPIMPKEPIRYLGRTLVVMGPDIDRWIDTLKDGHTEPQVTEEAWRRIEEYQVAKVQAT